MKMWEYGFAWGRNGNIYKTITGDDQEIPKVKKYISKMGRDGWELCGTLPERDGYMLIFKREPDEDVN
jgi:hypothetical protein